MSSFLAILLESCKGKLCAASVVHWLFTLQLIFVSAGSAVFQEVALDDPNIEHPTPNVVLKWSSSCQQNWGSCKLWQHQRSRKRQHHQENHLHLHHPNLRRHKYDLSISISCYFSYYYYYCYYHYYFYYYYHYHCEHHYLWNYHKKMQGLPRLNKAGQRTQKQDGTQHTFL